MAFAADLHEDVIQKAKPHTAPHIAASILNTLLTGAAWPLAWNVVSEVRRAIRHRFPQVDTYMEANCQAALVREIFGSPFRTICLDDSWLAPKVIALARTIAVNRVFDQVPLLADALEEERCTNAEILAHCRGKVPHVRGCWAVDLVLGKP
jgi:hypothetical protein